ncbi:unnamed protein product, partial [Brassica oleracea]
GDTEVTPIIDGDNQLENHIGTDGDHLAKEIIGDVVECTIGDRDQEELSKNVINMKELRSLALQSLPDSPGIRSTVWKLLLGYLPPEQLNNTPLRAERSQEAIVYVGNPDPQLSEEFLWECLIQAGHVGKLNALVHMNNLRLVASVSYGCWLYLEELVDFLCEEDIGYEIKVLNMIKLHGKTIRVNKASQDKKIIDVGCLWKQLKQWLIFNLRFCQRLHIRRSSLQNRTKWAWI